MAIACHKKKQWIANCDRWKEDHSDCYEDHEAMYAERAESLGYEYGGEQNVEQ